MSSDEAQSTLLINPLEKISTKLKLVEGIERLKRSIEKEIKCNTVPACSNLPHLLSLYQYIQKSESNPPSACLKNFPYKGGKTKKLTIDVVNAQGDNWIKISARNPKSLDLLAAGGGNYGARSILDHAEDYLKCAQENLNLFKPPKITFYFASGISQSLAEKLEDLGIEVEGTRIGDNEVKTHERIKNYQNIQPICDTDENETNSLSKNNNQAIEQGNLKLNFNNPDLTNVKKINLDITALLCYVSNLTNGHTDTYFKKPILEEQRQFEIARPQKHILVKAMEGKELYCCETAYNEFISILDVVGGEVEKQRAQELLKNVTIVPDQRTIRTEKLFERSLRGHLKKRSLTIFASGDAIEAVTLTANSGFVRSAKTQGVDFAVFIHESRALTEGKELWEKSLRKEKRENQE